MITPQRIDLGHKKTTKGGRGTAGVSRCFQHLFRPCRKMRLLSSGGSGLKNPFLSDASSTRAKSDHPGEVMPMGQFLLDVLIQVLAGFLAVLIPCY